MYDFFIVIVSNAIVYVFFVLGLYITFYLLGIGSYAFATMPYSGLLADMTHPSLRGVCSVYHKNKYYCCVTKR